MVKGPQQVQPTPPTPRMHPVRGRCGVQVRHPGVTPRKRSVTGAFGRQIRAIGCALCAWTALAACCGFDLCHK